MAQRVTAVRTASRRACVMALAAALCVGCGVVSGVADSRAVGPRYDRWETVIARPRAAVFDAAVKVLTDSGYVLAQANSGVSAVSTADRKVSSGGRGAQQPGTPLRSDYPIRLSLVLSEQGSDSTRLSIMGQYRPESSDQRGTVNARSDDWRVVRGIGEAILARLR